MSNHKSFFWRPPKSTPSCDWNLNFTWSFSLRPTKDLSQTKRPIVILEQYFGLAKLNSLSFIPLNLFECAYLLIFNNYVRAITGCNQSYTVKREITLNHVITRSIIIVTSMVSPMASSADRPYKYDRFWSFEKKVKPNIKYSTFFTSKPYR